MSYGRNLDFRVPPRSENRSGRYFNAAGVALPLGVPVVVDTSGTANNSLDLVPVILATGSQLAPKAGLGGVLLYEYGPAAFAGNDPYLTTYSDKDTAPAGAAVQVVNGSYVKVALKNTVSTVYLGTRTYPGRVMVAGIGIATPTVAVGDYLTPGTGNDTSGYWAETGTAANAWLVVTHVDNARGEVEARLAF